MNNAHLYTLVTRLEQAERAHLLTDQARPKSPFWRKATASIAQWRRLYQPWKTSKQATSNQFGEQPLRAE